MASYKPTPTDTAKLRDLTWVSAIGILTMAPPLPPAAACACTAVSAVSFVVLGLGYVILIGDKLNHYAPYSHQITSGGNPVVSAPNINQSPG